MYLCSVSTTSVRIATRFSLSFEIVGGRFRSSSSGFGLVAKPFLRRVCELLRFLSAELTESFEEERYGDELLVASSEQLSRTDSGFGSERQ